MVQQKHMCCYFLHNSFTEYNSNLACINSLIYVSTFLFSCRVDFAASAHLFRWRLVLGEHDVSITEGTETFHSVTQVIRHPAFTVPTETYSNDVALLRISPQATVH